MAQLPFVQFLPMEPEGDVMCYISEKVHEQMKLLVMKESGTLWLSRNKLTTEQADFWVRHMFADCFRKLVATTKSGHGCRPRLGKRKLQEIEVKKEEISKKIESIKETGYSQYSEQAEQEQEDKEELAAEELLTWTMVNRSPDTDKDTPTKESEKEREAREQNDLELEKEIRERDLFDLKTLYHPESTQVDDLEDRPFTLPPPEYDVIFNLDSKEQ